MKAIILAAGVGKRLQAASGGRPKCLLNIGGRTLLSRHLENLTNLGVTAIALVVGYRREAVQEAVAAESRAGTVTYVVNEAYERGSICSLWAARNEMTQDVLIMDADVLYHPVILRRLVESPFPSALLVDETVTQTTEECMVVARDGRIKALTKQVPADCDCLGEGVGFLKVARTDVPVLLDAVARCMDSGAWDMEYEDALKEFFEHVAVGYERVGGLPWMEIDFPEDVIRAEQEILPAISAMEPSSVS
ncbi:MAG: phosphocholine cytidylyltransferase family protein [Nitrospirae bacterium]|nr:MAG: phosphocholine cytidylyltransferase family protein [Nitrospirota bacterium]